MPLYRNQINVCYYILSPVIGNMHTEKLIWYAILHDTKKIGFLLTDK